MSRRVLRMVCAIGAVTGISLVIHDGSRANQLDLVQSTHTYKHVGDLSIQADVYHYSDDKIRPAIVWIHGGALIMGHREGIDRRVKQHALDAGYVLISLDYRLAPETQLPDMIKDVEDAFAWIRRDGPRLFHIDAKRIAVAGGSAGGYLTMTSGVRVHRPVSVPIAALLSTSTRSHAKPNPATRACASSRPCAPRTRVCT